MYARIIIDIVAEQVDRLFTYRIPDTMKVVPGMRVVVPFGHRTREGYVLEITETADIDEEKIKAIEDIAEDYPVLLPHMIRLAYEIKEKYHCCLCDALRQMIPAEMRGQRVHERTEECVRLLCSTDEVERKLEGVRMTPKRKLMLSVLADGAPHPFSELRVIIRDVPEMVRFFEEKGIVESFSREVLRSPARMDESRKTEPELTEEQKEVTGEVLPAIREGRGCIYLLHGVTSSGKTEVFIRLVKTVLKEGGSAIILVPEIILTPQMVDWFCSRFGQSAAVLHSKLSSGERFDEWRRIRRGDARIVIGARSAVFAPVDNLKLIVIDEEHEQSYQSEHTPQYDAREVAAMRIRNENAVLLLASATPSIYSYAMARRGDYILLEMTKRANGKPLPEVHIVDMRRELEMGNKNMFSSLLLSKLKLCISSGHQAMLFINRRGYAPVMKCRSCGATLKCSSCDVSMTLHNVDNMLHCHYCGDRKPVPNVCPYCGSAFLRPLGIGTQKVEEALRQLFPDVGIVRMDVDTTQEKNAYIDLLNTFRSGKARILLGTQMIAKGLDFPGVTLVGAILADMTLELPDYRSPERTYQLLVQVAGRAGRADEKGEVVIQTYKPEHYAIAAAAQQDYRAFFADEFARRKKDLYPPFTSMTRLLCEADDEETAVKTAMKLCERIEKLSEDNPKYKKRLLYVHCDKSPISCLRGKHRAQVLMKILNHPESEPIREFCSQLAREEWPCRVYCEFDPANLA